MKQTGLKLELPNRQLGEAIRCLRVDSGVSPAGSYCGGTHKSPAGLTPELLCTALAAWTPARHVGIAQCEGQAGGLICAYPRSMRPARLPLALTPETARMDKPGRTRRQKQCAQLWQCLKARRSSLKFAPPPATLAPWSKANQKTPDKPGFARTTCPSQFAHGSPWPAQRVKKPSSRCA